MTNGSEKVQWSALCRLAARQHGVVARWQLLALGMNSDEIQYRLETRRLHRVWRGVYAVGRPELSKRGIWMAAVLACGSDAGLSHHSAGALLEIHRDPAGEIHVSVPEHRRLRRPGIIIHRRGTLGLTRVDGIPVTSVVGTLIDLATRLTRAELEAAINAADKRGLIDPDRLRAALDSRKGPGVAILREVLDRRTFTLTDSQLERRLLPIARSTGLPDPVTQRIVNGYRVDFYWPELGLVVETDGLRYHRTPAQQARDRLRDQAHAAAGLTSLRFTHSQVFYEPGYVRATLSAVVARASGAR